MKLSTWTNRIANVRKIKNSRKSMDYQLGRLHEEVSEMFMEHRKSDDYRAVTWKKDDRGVNKPYGFMPELGDALIQLLHIADLTGIDPEEAMALSIEYHENKQAVEPPKSGKSTKKGK